MNKKIIRHPLRTIELLYHSDRSQPDWEKETLAQYVHVHDEVWRLKSMREESERRLNKAIAHREEIFYALLKFRQRLRLLEAVTGIIDSVHARPLDNSGVFRIDMNEMRANRKFLSNETDNFIREMASCKEEYNTFKAEFDKFDKWFEAFSSGPLLEIYQRYDEVSVDTVSLDNDHQNLLQLWQPITWDEYAYKDKALSAFTISEETIEIRDEIAEGLDLVEEALRKQSPTIEKEGFVNIRLDEDGEYRAF